MFGVMLLALYLFYHRRCLFICTRGVHSFWSPLSLCTSLSDLLGFGSSECSRSLAYRDSVCVQGGWRRVVAYRGLVLSRLFLVAFLVGVHFFASWYRPVFARREGRFSSPLFVWRSLGSDRKLCLSFCVICGLQNPVRISQLFVFVVELVFSVFFRLYRLLLSLRRLPF